MIAQKQNFVVESSDQNIFSGDDLITMVHIYKKKRIIDYVVILITQQSVGG